MVRWGIEAQGIGPLEMSLKVHLSLAIEEMKKQGVQEESIRSFESFVVEVIYRLANKLDLDSELPVNAPDKFTLDSLQIVPVQIMRVVKIGSATTASRVNQVINFHL